MRVYATHHLHAVPSPARRWLLVAMWVLGIQPRWSTKASGALPESLSLQGQFVYLFMCPLELFPPFNRSGCLRPVSDPLVLGEKNNQRGDFHSHLPT